jgi:HAE1 family hydrophobic/amphiphilic exporter-1
VRNAVAFAGFSGATFTNASNTGVIFAGLEPFEDRVKNGLSAGQIIGNLFGRLQSIQEAFIIAVPPPAVPGIGNSGGFKLQIQNRTDDNMAQVLTAAQHIIGQASQTPDVMGVYTTFSTSSPQLFLEIDRTKAQMLNVPISAIFDALQVNLGSAYVNDFNAFGRVYQVRAQADQRFRLETADIMRLKVRSANGALVPLGTLVNVVDKSGPTLVQRYNMYVSVPIQGSAAPGTSSGEALAKMEQLSANLPPGMGYEWTELSLQEKLTGNTAIYVFILAVVFVFLALAAQYESWVMPLSIMLIVPMCVLAALGGISLMHMQKDILVEIGLIVLVGLAAKNAILIVEFARRIEGQEHKTPVEAVIEACRLRLRPILMTAFAFILGVLPLAIATGPGAEMRQSLGVAVFAGMLGVTAIGLFFTPVFYVALRLLVLRKAKPKAAPSPAE